MVLGPDVTPQILILTTGPVVVIIKPYPAETKSNLAFATSIELGQSDQVLFCWLTNIKFSS